MRYYINESDGYITSLSTVNLEGDGNAAAEDFARIMDIFDRIPPAPEGFEYRLRTDNLHWELFELPEPEPEQEFEFASAEV